MTPVSAPTVSICVPSYNAERFVGETLRSVFAQTYTDYELILVDDASDDATLSVVESFSDARLSVFRNETRLGAAGNWNAAIAKARGHYVKLLCSDDVLAPDCVERQVGVLDDGANATVAMVGGRRDVIDTDGRVLFRARGGGGLDGRVDGRRAIRRTVQMATTPFGEPSFVMLRRSVLDEIGEFRGNYGYVVDMDLWARVLRHHDYFGLDGTLGSFRVSNSSWTSRLAARQGREARRWFREVAADPAFGVTKPDLALCLTKTHLLSRARRSAFAVAEWRSKR